jgi:hypothetical protein
MNRNPAPAIGGAYCKLILMPSHVVPQMAHMSAYAPKMSSLGAEKIFFGRDSPAEEGGDVDSVRIGQPL